MIQSIFAEPLPEDQIMFQGEFWEAFNLALWVIMLIYSIKTLGKWTTIKIFLIGMIYGLVLENGGPMSVPALGFEGYFWENNYKLYLFEFFGYGIRISSVPMATHLGWSNVFLICYLFYEQIARAFPKIREGLKATLIGGLIMTTSGLLLDLQLDPIATRFRWWVWNTDLLPVWFGVPLINYVAWFWAVFTFGAGWVYVHQFQKNKDGSPLSEKQQALWLVYLMVPMWVFDTFCVMATKGILNLLGVMYIVPTPVTIFEWLSIALVIAGFGVCTYLYHKKPDTLKKILLLR